jgi:inactive dipeptidyl peptidase 10
MPVRLKGSSLAANQRMQYAEWLGNTTSLVIINENDIYLRQSPSDEKDVRLTHTGVPGLIYNGVTDFLYQGRYTHKKK